MDVDMSNPPEVLPETVRKWREGSEMVIGMRRCRTNDSSFKLLSASLFCRLVSRDRV